MTLKPPTWTLALLVVAAGGGRAHAQVSEGVGFRRPADAFPTNCRGGRVAIGDVDLDGDPDVLIGGRLLLNTDGKGTFRYAPASAGLNQQCRAAILLDFDRDGDLDVFSTDPDRLLRNDSAQGTVRFTDASAAVRIPDDGLPGEGLGAADLNGDGFPDVYVANYELGGLGQGTADRLYVSDGRGRFFTHPRVGWSFCGRGVNVADFDQDGDADVYVSNYRLQTNQLFVNRLREDSRLGFSLDNQAGARGIDGGAAHTIGSCWGDLDGDGDLDMIMGNLSHRGQPMVQVALQQAGGRFVTQSGSRFGIAWQEAHSNPTLFDIDDDGDLDLYLTSTYQRMSYVYRNRLVEEGRLTFTNATRYVRGGIWGTWGCAAADVDLDGDQDLIVGVEGRPPVLLLNERAQRWPGRQSVRFRLQGTTSDRWGAGATAILSGGGARRTVRQLYLGHGTSSQSEPILHFGVGNARGPFDVEVRWPSGKVNRFSVPSGGLYVVEEPRGPDVRPVPWATTPASDLPFPGVR